MNEPNYQTLYTDLKRDYDRLLHNFQLQERRKKAARESFEMFLKKGGLDALRHQDQVAPQKV